MFQINVKNSTMLTWDNDGNKVLSSFWNWLGTGAGTSREFLVHVDIGWSTDGVKMMMNQHHKNPRQMLMSTILQFGQSAPSNLLQNHTKWSHWRRHGKLGFIAQFMTRMALSLEISKFCSQCNPSWSLLIEDCTSSANLDVFLQKGGCWSSNRWNCQLVRDGGSWGRWCGFMFQTNWQFLWFCSWFVS